LVNAEKVATEGGLLTVRGAAALSALVVWHLFLSEKEGARVAVSSGVQEANIVVKGGYTPDVLVVKAGRCI